MTIFDPYDQPAPDEISADESEFLSAEQEARIDAGDGLELTPQERVEEHTGRKYQNNPFRSQPPRYTEQEAADISGAGRGALLGIW